MQLYFKLNVSLEQKTSHKQHRYICNNSQQYIVWVKMISFMAKIIRIFSKDRVPSRYVLYFLSKRNFGLVIRRAQVFMRP